MQQTELSFDRLPEAIARLIDEVAQLRESLQRLGKPPSALSRPIGIDEACAIVMKAKPTVYKLVHQGLIPHCKIGHKLYFQEDELLEWIAKGKKKGITETKSDIETQMLGGVKQNKRSDRF